MRAAHPHHPIPSPTQRPVGGAGVWVGGGTPWLGQDGRLDGAYALLKDGGSSPAQAASLTRDTGDTPWGLGSH